MLLFGPAVSPPPDRNVTLGLSWDDPTGRGSSFDRLDWRPLDAHTNRGLGPPRHRLAVIEGSHHHPLAENAVLPMGLLRTIAENLPVALPINPDPPDWPAFLAVAEQRWNLHGLRSAPLPPWQYDLGLPIGEKPAAGKGRKT